jgi:hypothetical protein
MYRYMPPKSNVWGHALRKMPVAREKQLFGQFLETAVAEYGFSMGSLTVFASSDEIVERFERLLNVTAHNRSFPALSPQQCEKCLEELIAYDAMKPSEASSFMFTQRVEISKWRIDRAEVPTNSSFLLYYGRSARIATFLYFETVEQFRWIKHIFEDLRFCKLNEKHLKLEKRRWIEQSRTM